MQTKGKCMTGWGGLDDALLRWMNTGVGRWPLLDKTMSWLLDASLLKFGVYALAFIWIWTTPHAQQWRRRQVIVLSTLAGLLGLLLGRALSLGLPFRERPFARPELGLMLPPDYAAAMRSWSAFPSDHAVMAFAMVTGLWLISRRLGLLAALHALLVISLPRLYMSLHHPSDVLAGAMLGAALGWGLNRPACQVQVADRVLRLAARWPPAFHTAAFLLLYQLTTMFEGLRGFAVSFFKALRLLL
jgi:membrane-associated phospholipid phosphatase